MLTHAGNELGGHSGKSILAFVPNNPLTRKIMDKVKGSIPGKYGKALLLFEFPMIGHSCSL